MYTKHSSVKIHGHRAPEGRTLMDCRYDLQVVVGSNQTKSQAVETNKQAMNLRYRFLNMRCPNLCHMGLRNLTNTLKLTKRKQYKTFCSYTQFAQGYASIPCQLLTSASKALLRTLHATKAHCVNQAACRAVTCPKDPPPSF